jgi:hypothetical protein
VFARAVERVVTTTVVRAKMSIEPELSYHTPLVGDNSNDGIKAATYLSLTFRI